MFVFVLVKKKGKIISSCQIIPVMAEYNNSLSVLFFVFVVFLLGTLQKVCPETHNSEKRPFMATQTDPFHQEAKTGHTIERLGN